MDKDLLCTSFGLKFKAELNDQINDLLSHFEGKTYWFVEKDMLILQIIVNETCLISIHFTPKKYVFKIIHSKEFNNHPLTDKNHLLKGKYNNNSKSLIGITKEIYDYLQDLPYDYSKRFNKIMDLEKQLIKGVLPEELFKKEIKTVCVGSLLVQNSRNELFKMEKDAINEILNRVVKTLDEMKECGEINEEEYNYFIKIVDNSREKPSKYNLLIK